MEENTILAIALKALKGGGGSGGTSNYNDLNNKPKIENVELSGNKSASDLNLASLDDLLTRYPTFIGATADWNNLTPQEKAEYIIVHLTDDTKSVGGGANLTEDLTSAITVGGIDAGTLYTQGTSLEDLFKDLLAPTLYPSFTNPSATLSATGAKLLEKGDTLTTVFTITFNRGSISPAYGTDGYRAGAASDYTLDGTTQAGNTFNITVTESKTSYQGSVSYGAGQQPKDSKGNDYDSPLSAGSLNTNTVSYEFVEAMWSNVANITAITKMALVSKSTKQRDMIFPAQTVANPEVFDVPASWTVTAVQVKNDLSGQYENASSQFDVTNVTHDDASGTSVDYKRYTFNMGMATGSRTVRIKWS